MKGCELCKAAARMFCESDQASLCWDCDARVHSANFLVARHSRSLLCHACQSPTVWNASGAKLGLTLSVCESCVSNSGGMNDERREEDESEGQNNEEIDTGDEYDEEEEDDVEDDDDDEDFGGHDEDGENQVVPWSSTPPPPSLSTSSSTSEEANKFSDGEREDSLKQMRENVAYLSFDGDPGSSSIRNNRTLSLSPAALGDVEDEVAIVDTWSMRPSKARRIEPDQSDRNQNGSAGLRSAAIVESLRRFQEQDIVPGNNSSKAIAEFYRLSRNPDCC